MSPTMPDTEARVRESLRRWADSVEPSAGDPHAAMAAAAETDRRSRGRWPLLAVAAAVLVVVALAAVLLRPKGDQFDQVPADTVPAPAVHVDLGALPYVVFRPADARWTVKRLTINTSSTDVRPRVWLSLTGPDQGSLEITVSPTGSTGPGSSPLPSEVLTVRGNPAVETDEGANRFRVSWDEAGLSWMADGQPFATRDEMVALLDDLAIVDEGTWQAWLAPEARAIVTAHPDGGLDYYSGQGAATVATAAPRQPVATALTPR